MKSLGQRLFESGKIITLAWYLSPYTDRTIYVTLRGDKIFQNGVINNHCVRATMEGKIRFQIQDEANDWIRKHKIPSHYEIEIKNSTDEYVLILTDSWGSEISPSNSWMYQNYQFKHYRKQFMLMNSVLSEAWRRMGLDLAKQMVSWQLAGDRAKKDWKDINEKLKVKK